MTFFALIGFEEVVKAVSESRSSADRWIRSIFCIPYKMLKSQKYKYVNYNIYQLKFDGLLAQAHTIERLSHAPPVQRSWRRRSAMTLAFSPDLPKDLVTKKKPRSMTLRGS